MEDIPPTVDLTSCRDLLYWFSTDQWTDITTQVLGGAATIRYGGIINQDTPGNDEYWIRVNTQIVSEDQETLRNWVRRFRSDGIITLQLFCPITDINCLVNADKLSEGLRNAFRTYQGENMEFTSCRVQDNISPESNWLRVNIMSNFTYRQFL